MWEWGKAPLGNTKRRTFTLPFRRHVLLGASWKIKQIHLFVRWGDYSAITSYSHHKERHKAFRPRTDLRDLAPCSQRLVDRCSSETHRMDQFSLSSVDFLCRPHHFYSHTGLGIAGDLEAEGLSTFYYTFSPWPPSAMLP